MGGTGSGMRDTGSGGRVWRSGGTTDGHPTHPALRAPLPASQGYAATRRGGDGQGYGRGPPVAAAAKAVDEAGNETGDAPHEELCADRARSHGRPNAGRVRLRNAPVEADSFRFLRSLRRGAGSHGLRWHGWIKARRSPRTLLTHRAVSPPHPARHRPETAFPSPEGSRGLGSPSTRRMALRPTRAPLLRVTHARCPPPTTARQHDVPDMARHFQPVPERGTIPERPRPAEALFVAGSGLNLARLRARCPGHGGARLAQRAASP